MYINTLIIKFKNKIQPFEIPMFRGAIIDSASDRNKLLLHNHEGDGYRYKYPLVQYKRINGQATIVCIGQGVEEIGTFFSNSNFTLQLGDNKPTLFEIESIIPYRTQIQVWDEPFIYHLHNWLPLNHENHQKYIELEGIIERTQMLEEILIGNILSACKGVGYTVKDKITCKILNTKEPKTTLYKRLPYLSLDCEFKSNISLPNYIGLGKNSSMGHGIIVLLNNNSNT